jgi:hypothetical protein
MKNKPMHKLHSPLLLALFVTSVLFGTALLTQASLAEEVAVIKHSADEPQQNQSLTATLQIDSEKLVAGEQPKARLFEKYNPVNRYEVELKADEKKPGYFTINSEPLPVGKYRLIVEVPIKRTLFGLPAGSTLKTLTYDFTIHLQLARNCFNFNDKQKDVMGWTTSHVYIAGREQPISEPTCPGLFYVNTSWPGKLNVTSDGGSLFVPISAECFPKTSNQMSDDPHWQFSLISPDLSSHSEWQQLSAIDFRIATNKIPVKVLPEVHYLLDNKKTSTIFKDVLRKKNEIVGEGWYVISYPFELPKEAVVTAVELHIYGIPEQTVGSDVNSIFIDGVCPIK